MVLHLSYLRAFIFLFRSCSHVLVAQFISKHKHFTLWLLLIYQYIYRIYIDSFIMLCYVSWRFIMLLSGSGAKENVSIMFKQGSCTGTYTIHFIYLAWTNLKESLQCCRFYLEAKGPVRRAVARCPWILTGSAGWFWEHRKKSKKVNVEIMEQKNREK